MTVTLDPKLEQLDHDIAQLQAYRDQQARERQARAQAEAQRQAELAAVELERRIDAIKASVPPIATITDALDAIRSNVPTFQSGVLQRINKVTAAITDAHSTTSPRVQLGPNGAWVVIDRERISTHRNEIGTEAAALCAEILHAAGEVNLARECRDRVRSGNRINPTGGQKGNNHE